MPKKLHNFVDAYYTQHTGGATELRELYLYLLGGSDVSPIVKGCAVRKGRLEKLMLLLPRSFIAKLEKKNPGYLSQFMLCDRNAHTIHADFHEQVRVNSDAILNEMETLARALLYDGQAEMFDKAALKKLLFDDFCETKDGLKNTPPKVNPYRRRLEFCFDLDPALALARMVLYLSLGPYGNRDLDYILPSESSTFHSGNSGPDKDMNAQKSYADYLYDEGNVKEAFAIYNSIAGQLNNGNVFYRIARMYETGNGCAKDYLKAFQYYKKSADRKDADGYFGLARCYLNGIGQSADAEKARIYMEKAYEAGSRSAARDIGMAYYAGNSQMGYGKDIELAKFYFMEGVAGDSHDDVALTCLYMLGVCYEKHSKNSDAINAARNYYMKAASFGHYSSEQRLLDMGWMETAQNTDSSESGEVKEQVPWRFCFFNCVNDEALSMTDSVSSEGYEIVCGEISDVITSHLAASDLQNLMKNHPHAEILFYFFHPCEAKNRNDACKLLEYLKNMAQKHRELVLWLQESMRIFLRSTDTLTTTLIDSIISSLRNIYFQVRICNPYKDASEWLFSNLPLFLPNMKDSRKNRINVTIMGDSPCVPWLVRNAISVCHTKLPFTLSIITPDVKQLKRSLKRDCAGIFKYQHLIKTDLKLFEYESDDPEIGDMFSYNFKTDDPVRESMANAVRNTDYFILASDDSSYNLEQATKLREWCLKNDPSFSRFPIIASYCPDSRLSWQSQKFTVGNAPMGYQWYNNYNICCFGAFTDLYSAFNLTEGLLERRALETHLSYYGDLSDEKARYSALRSYYSRYYNRDSSRCSAINLIYRAFAVGIHLDNTISYGIAQNERTLADAYERWLSGTTKADHDKLMLAARLEHERWCNYMLSRGWEPATTDQMSVYMQRGNPGHQFYLAKLHPYICSWEDLGDDHNGVQYHLNQTLKSLNPDAKPKHLKEMNAENVRSSMKLFRL